MLVAKVSGGEFRKLLFAVVSNRSGLILLVLDVASEWSRIIVHSFVLSRRSPRLISLLCLLRLVSRRSKLSEVCNIAIKTCSGSKLAKLLML